MEPLSSNQKILTWLCILPSNKIESKSEKLAHIAFITSLIVLEFCVFTSCSAFVLQNASTDLGAALYGLLQAAASFGISYMLISGLLLSRQKIAAMFQNLSNLYNESKNLSCAKAFSVINSVIVLVL